MTYRINFSLTFLLLAFVCIASSGYAQTAADAAKIREKVKEYSDSNKKVRVTTSLGETSKGRIVKYSDNDFTLKDSKTDSETVFEYGKVAKVRKSKFLSTTTIITLAATGTVAAIVAGVLLKRCRNEGGC